MQKNARWIWNDSDEYEKNMWVCFRKEFNLDITEWDGAVLNIAADSRYTVYINGNWVGTGPIRYWPQYITWDSYDVTMFLTNGINTISAEVNHYGTSTSQYIHGKGGLCLSLDIEHDGSHVYIQSDQNFRCIENLAYSKNTLRVNIAQPWVEVYDARLFNDTYKYAGFDDSNWEIPCEVPSEDPIYQKMHPSDITEMAHRYAYPKTVLEKQALTVKGQCITLDFRPYFYAKDTTTIDRMQLGWFATIIKCKKQLYGKVKNVMKTRRLVINGIEIILSDKDFVSITLKEGKNLILLDNAGVFQRLECSVYFEFDSMLEFENPMDISASSPFCAIGPFEHILIGNIVCADGFKMDWMNSEYLAVGKCADIGELQAYSKWIKPMNIQDVDYESNNYRLAFAEYKKLPLLPQDRNMAVSNGSFTEIPPGDTDTFYILDFGVQIGGLIEIEINAERGTRIDLLGFEYMYLNGNIDIPFDLNNSMSYIANGKRSIYSFHRRTGFRYIALTVRKGYSKPVKIYRVQALERIFPVDEPGEFFCSDSALNKIWEISRTTLLKSMDDVFIDSCFEQALWIGDERCESLFQDYVFGSDELRKRNCRMAAFSMQRSELPECHVPAGVGFLLTAWALLWIISCEECAMHSGDMKFVEEIYPFVNQAATTFLKYINEQGLLEIDAWNLFDWAPMDTPFNGIVAHQNGFLALALDSTVKLAGLMNDTKAVEKFTEEAKKLRESIDTHFWNETRNAYVDCIRREEGQSEIVSVQTQSIMLLSNCVPQEKKEIVLSYLLNKPADFVDIGSPFSAFFYYEVLARHDEYLTFIKDIKKHWGRMIDHGDTTCWETFLGFDPDRPTRSHSHAWSSSPCYLFGKYLLGINLEGFACSNVRIAPKLCGLSWARGTVPTAQGYIKVYWHLDDNILHIDISVPSSLNLTTKVPQDNCKVNIIRY